MKKSFFNFMIIICLLTVMPNGISAEGQEQNTVSNVPIEFPIVYHRATNDASGSFAADEKGTILIVSFNHFLNITHDNGKTWVSRSLPSKEMYSVFYVNGKFYLSTASVDQRYSVLQHYVSTDGDQWVPFSLSDHSTMMTIQYINGKYILLADQGVFSNDTLVFTSVDGVSFEKISVIPHSISFLTWNGTRFTAYGGGYEFEGKPMGSRNQLLTDAKKKTSAEMIIYTSNDLLSWTMQSGTVKPNLSYEFYNNGIPAKNYSYLEEEPVSDGVIHLYDYFGNTITSKDGINFMINRKYSLTNREDYRSPIFKVGKQYVFFSQYWSTSGMKTNILTSTDKVKWKKTKLDKAINGMYVIQAGETLIGSNEGEIMISNNGFDWKKIR
jgi:hypothetical protein